MLKKIITLGCLSLLYTSNVFASLEFETVELKPFNNKANKKWGSVLTDVIQHTAPGDKNTYSDLVTQAHETTHGIHSYLRGKYYNSKSKINAFYILDDRGVIVEEPKIRKSKATQYVPRNLRGHTYNLYIAGQKAWDDTPLYIWDEWISYANGSAAGIDLANEGLWTYGWRDAVGGLIEFVVYSTAIVMAIQDGDPHYFENNQQFMSFFKWHMERSMSLFLTGKEISHFKWQDQEDYYKRLVESPEASEMRDFLKNLFGADWTASVMGF